MKCNGFSRPDMGQLQFVQLQLNYN